MQAKKVFGGLYWVLFVTALTANAHPGHGSLPLSAESIAHYTFEPVHVLPALFAGLVLSFAIRRMLSYRWRGVVRK